MLQNPLNPTPHQDIKTRVRKGMQRKQINPKIMTVFYETYEWALSEENIVLAHAEKQRLVKQLIEEILTELIAENKK